MRSSSVLRGSMVPRNLKSIAMSRHLTAVRGGRREAVCSGETGETGDGGETGRVDWWVKKGV